jgi:response regulator RpfG family c-di-GMP phosphodiesterase
MEMKVLRYAGLLHDFGKIGVPERILTKSHKLEPSHFEVVKSRLFALRQEKKAQYSARIAAAFKEQNDRELAEAIEGQLEQQLRAELADLDGLVEMLGHANDPAITMLPDDDYARQQELLQRLSSMTYEDETGQRAPLLTEDERQALSIRKGSLTLEEYRSIQTHAQLSYEFLSQIQWTDEFARIPLIAWAHHEKLNGKGYPRGVMAEQIPLQARMMTVADIYDALTASDRPYKKSLPLERALHILRSEATDGSLDKDVVELFIAQQIYLRTADQEPSQGSECKPLAS